MKFEKITGKPAPEVTLAESGEDKTPTGAPVAARAPKPGDRPGDRIADTVESLYGNGFGAVTVPEIERQIARIVLFKRMRKHCKPDLERLRATCLPLYVALYKLGGTQLRAKTDFPRVITTGTSTALHKTAVLVSSWTALEQASGVCPAAEELRAKLSAWATERNIVVVWFLDALLRNLAAWHLFPQLADELVFTFPTSFAHSTKRRFSGSSYDQRVAMKLAASGPSIDLPIYNPAFQTREEHQAEVLGKLLRYHVVQESKFLTSGFVRTRLRRGRRGDPWEPIDWFIEYQMHGLLAKEIVARSTGEGSLGESAISQAVGEACELLEVPRRRRSRKLSTPLKGLGS